MNQANLYLIHVKAIDHYCLKRSGSLMLLSEEGQGSDEIDYMYRYIV